ncbi:unnamed protein product [Amoebophrya sp. A25]|nr:unnamed protein product [Amoebophrya sp. A25]|eukprot:GSA25T00005806001.1
MISKKLLLNLFVNAWHKTDFRSRRSSILDLIFEPPQH